MIKAAGSGVAIGVGVSASASQVFSGQPIPLILIGGVLLVVVGLSNLSDAMHTVHHGDRR